MQQSRNTCRLAANQAHADLTGYLPVMNLAEYGARPNRRGNTPVGLTVLPGGEGGQASGSGARCWKSHALQKKAVTILLGQLARLMRRGCFMVKQLP